MDYKIDEAWKADEDGKRRIYEGMVSIEKNDPNTGRRKSLKVFSGRFSMEEGPHRLREVSEQKQLPVHGNTPSVPEEDGSYSLESPLKEEQVESRIKVEDYFVSSEFRKNFKGWLTSLPPKESTPVNSLSEEELDPSEEEEAMDSFSLSGGHTEAEDGDVVMSFEDKAANLTLLLEDICDETGKLKEDFVEEAKDSMERYLRKLRRRSI